MFNTRRIGIASVIGTMIFLLVLMLAIGAQAYMSNVQTQSQQIVQQELNLADTRGSERLTFSSSSGSVSVLGSGPVTSQIVQLIIKFSNGTVYDLPENSVVPSGYSLSVQPLVGGGCGSTSCQRRYSSIVGGASPGSIGLLTSYGNIFWYFPSQTTTTQVQTYWVTSGQSTSSTSYVPVTGLSFTGALNARYEVSFVIGYYQSIGVSPGVSMAVSIPAGATVFGCGGMNYPLLPQKCVTSSNTAIGTTIFPGNTLISANYCNLSSSPCAFAATLDVVFAGGGGTFQVEFAASPTTTATIVANSMMTVVQD